MKTVSEKVWLAAVGLIVLYSVYPSGVVLAESVAIDGLGPLAPVTATGITPVVKDKRLELRLPEQPLISVESWPAFLPQEFKPQNVDAARQIRPSGPADRIAFTRQSEERPWLLVGTGATQANELVEGWQLQFDGTSWSVTNGDQEKSLRTANKPARPTILAVGKERWCVYLLHADVPQKQAGVATEGEPRASWAAVRLSSGKLHCD